ncbi:MAG: aminotransferase class V-fold PLP-dependent enzyme [Rhodospirillales bacterium]|nr:aminotransferase class V-fold PLP-dependent enzyme [Rhodospirillales bacterium]
MELDTDFARRLFPAPCWKTAFFENAGGSYVPRSVIDRTVAYMTECQVQPHWPFASSRLATERIAAGHTLMAAMLNAEEDEITISQSTRGNFYVLANALRPLMSPGDEIIVTNLDHESNIGFWRRLADVGVVVKEWRVNKETAELEIAGLERLLTDRTRLVCVVQCSNITGAINDIPRIAKIVHDAGAWICVDGVAYAAHRLIDVKAWDVDFYAVSLYKLFGPHISVLYCKRERLDEAVNQNTPFRGDRRRKLNPGDPSHELTPAIVGIGDYFDALYRHHFKQPENDFRARLAALFRLIARHEQGLAARFVDYIGNEPAIHLVGPLTADPARRAPTFSFTVKGRRSAEIPPILAAENIAIASGNFGVFRLIPAVGIDRDDGVVRASMAHYNTLDEVDRLIAGFGRVV